MTASPAQREPSSDETQALAIHPDMVLLARYDPDSGELRVHMANPAAVRLLGPSASDLIGRPLRSLLIDESVFTLRAQRDIFFAELRRRQVMEFPGLARVLDVDGRRRHLRVRLCWPDASDSVVVIAEDVSERDRREERSGATERLRSAIAVSGLLSHHVNNALAGAMLNVEVAQLQLRQSQAEAAAGSLEQALASMKAAADVVAALAAGAGAQIEATESCNLAAALRNAALTTGAGKLELDVQMPDEPVFVWGTRAQLQAILGGLLPVLWSGSAASVRVSVARDESAVRLRLSSGAPGKAWMRVLLDPGEPQPASDTRSVRLFASMQVLRAIGGQLGLPSWGDERLTIELRLLAAPGPVNAPEPAPSVLLVSSDGALRAAATALLTRCDVEYCDDLHDGIAWLMRPRAGVVICDADELEMPLGNLLALVRLATGGDSPRLLLASRRAPEPALPIPQVCIPFDPVEIQQRITLALGKE